MRVPRPVLAALLVVGTLSTVVVLAIAASAATRADSGRPRTRPVAAHSLFIGSLAGAARANARTYHVPASVTLAQAILESGWGTSSLSANGHNYFGIKCGNGGYGPLAVGCRRYATTECRAGRCAPTVASFRVYRTVGDSLADHARFLLTNARYAAAFAYRNNPNQFAVRLQQCGYATSPTYARDLQTLMRQYNLYRYDVRIP